MFSAPSPISTSNNAAHRSIERSDPVTLWWLLQLKKRSNSGECVSYAHVIGLLLGLIHIARQQGSQRTSHRMSRSS